METASETFKELAATSRRLAQRLFTIGENRIELLTVEVQEERVHLLHAILLALSVAAFGLLAAMTLTAAIVVCLWARSPVAVLLILTVLYGAAGGIIWRHLNERLYGWRSLSASLDQLRKDRECLEKILT